MHTNAKLSWIAALAAVGAILAYASYPQEPAPLPAAPRDPDYFAFVPSMVGTQADGALHTAADEQLVVDAELRHLFDYYLAALGEKDLPAIRAQIESELQHKLKPKPAQQAKRLLAQYLDYKRALAGVEANLAPPANPAAAARARLQAMQQLRTTYFSASESAGLFGDSDMRDLDAIARLDVAYNAQLTPAQKKERYTALDAKLSPAEQAERAAPVRILQLEESVRQARANGADDNEVYRMRAATLSPDAADRLAQLDREEAEWQRRIAAYQAERSRLLGQRADDSALQQLRTSQFSPQEQKRLTAYE
jgi:lipase chaperone LimK